MGPVNVPDPPEFVVPNKPILMIWSKVPWTVSDTQFLFQLLKFGKKESRKKKERKK